MSDVSTTNWLSGPPRAMIDPVIVPRHGYGSGSPASCSISVKSSGCADEVDVLEDRHRSADAERHVPAQARVGRTHVHVGDDVVDDPRIRLAPDHAGSCFRHRWSAASDTPTRCLPAKQCRPWMARSKRAGCSVPTRPSPTIVPFEPGSSNCGTSAQIESPWNPHESPGVTELERWIALVDRQHAYGKLPPALLPVVESRRVQLDVARASSASFRRASPDRARSPCRSAAG